MAGMFDPIPSEDFPLPKGDGAPAETNPGPTPNYEPDRDPDALTFTIKGGVGYDAPWFVFRAASAVDMNRLLSDPPLREAIEQACKVSDWVINHRGGTQASTPPAQSTTPAHKQAPNGMIAPSCDHGHMVYRSGVSKKGNKYELFACPSDVCKPEWIDSEKRK